MASRGAHLSANATVTAHGAVPIVPGTTEIPVTRAIYIGGGGNVEVVMADGQTVVFTAAIAGSVLPIQVSQVLATNTTATLLLALY